MDMQLSEFHEYVMKDLFAEIPSITSKKMFGGYGIYKRGIIFAIITNEARLYFKVDDALKEKFKEHGSDPFVFSGFKKRGPVEMAYWTLPEEVMEDTEELAHWVDDSVKVSKKSK